MEYKNIFNPKTLEKLNKASAENLKQMMGDKNLIQAIQSSVELLQQIAEAEKPYKDQLEKLAVKMINELYPIIKEDNIILDAKLVPMSDVNKSIDEIKVVKPIRFQKALDYIEDKWFDEDEDWNHPSWAALRKAIENAQTLYQFKLAMKVFFGDGWEKDAQEIINKAGLKEIKVNNPSINLKNAKIVRLVCKKDNEYVKSDSIVDLIDIGGYYTLLPYHGMEILTLFSKKDFEPYSKTDRDFLLPEELEILEPLLQNQKIEYINEVKVNNPSFKYNIKQKVENGYEWVGTILDRRHTYKEVIKNPINNEYLGTRGTAEEPWEEEGDSRDFYLVHFTNIEDYDHPNDELIVWVVEDELDPANVNEIKVVRPPRTWDFTKYIPGFDEKSIQIGDTIKTSSTSIKIDHIDDSDDNYGMFYENTFIKRGFGYNQLNKINLKNFKYSNKLDESITPESRRRIINAVTQGAALRGAFAFYLFKEHLDELDPSLVEKYNQIMKNSFGIYDDENAIAMMLSLLAQGHKFGGGSSKVVINEIKINTPQQQPEKGLSKEDFNKLLSSIREKFKDRLKDFNEFSMYRKKDISMEDYYKIYGGKPNVFQYGTIYQDAISFGFFLEDVTEDDKRIIGDLVNKALKGHLFQGIKDVNIYPKIKWDVTKGDTNVRIGIYFKNISSSGGNIAEIKVENPILNSPLEVKSQKHWDKIWPILKQKGYKWADEDELDEFFSGQHEFPQYIVKYDNKHIYIDDTGNGESNPKEIFESEESGITIKARAICFPMLVHELIKGLYELVSLQGFKGDKQSNQNVVNKVDTLQNEPSDIRYGKFIFDALNEIFASSKYSNPKIREFFFAEVYKLEDEEFLPFIENAINEELTSEQKKWVDNTLREIDSDLKADEAGLDEIKINDPKELRIGQKYDIQSDVNIHKQYYGCIFKEKETINGNEYAVFINPRVQQNSILIPWIRRFEYVTPSKINEIKINNPAKGSLSQEEIEYIKEIFHETIIKNINPKFDILEYIEENHNEPDIIFDFVIDQMIFNNYEIEKNGEEILTSHSNRDIVSSKDVKEYIEENNKLKKYLENVFWNYYINELENSDIYNKLLSEIRSTNKDSNRNANFNELKQFIINFVEDEMYNQGFDYPEEIFSGDEFENYLRISFLKADIIKENKMSLDLTKISEIISTSLDKHLKETKLFHPPQIIKEYNEKTVVSTIERWKSEDKDVDERIARQLINRFGQIKGSLSQKLDIVLLPDDLKKGNTYLNIDKYSYKDMADLIKSLPENPEAIKKKAIAKFEKEYVEKRTAQSYVSRFWTKKDELKHAIEHGLEDRNFSAADVKKYIPNNLLRNNLYLDPNNWKWQPFEEMLDSLFPSQKEAGEGDEINSAESDADKVYDKDGIEIYKTDDKSKCISYNPSIETTKRKKYGWCVAQPGNSNYDYYRLGEKSPTFYFLFDRSLPSTPEHSSFDNPWHAMAIQVNNDGESFVVTNADNAGDTRADSWEAVSKIVPTGTWNKIKDLKKYFEPVKLTPAEKFKKLTSGRNLNLEEFKELTQDEKIAYIQGKASDNKITKDILEILPKYKIQYEGRTTTLANVAIDSGQKFQYNALKDNEALAKRYAIFRFRHTDYSKDPIPLPYVKYLDDAAKEKYFKLFDEQLTFEYIEKYFGEKITKEYVDKQLKTLDYLPLEATKYISDPKMKKLFTIYHKLFESWQFSDDFNANEDKLSDIMDMSIQNVYPKPIILDQWKKLSSEEKDVILKLVLTTNGKKEYSTLLYALPYVIKDKDKEYILLPKDNSGHLYENWILISKEGKVIKDNIDGSETTIKDSYLVNGYPNIEENPTRLYNMSDIKFEEKDEK